MTTNLESERSIPETSRVPKSLHIFTLRYIQPYLLPYHFITTTLRSITEKLESSKTNCKVIHRRFIQRYLWSCHYLEAVQLHPPYGWQHASQLWRKFVTMTWTEAWLLDSSHSSHPFWPPNHVQPLPQTKTIWNVGILSSTKPLERSGSFQKRIPTMLAMWATETL